MEKLMPLKMWFMGLTVAVIAFALGLWSAWRAITMFFFPTPTVPHAWVALGLLSLFSFCLGFRQMGDLIEDKEDAEYNKTPSHS
jgi:hypothetical protein